jgi:hypothetical protein
LMSEDVSETAVSLPVQPVQKITPWFWKSRPHRDVMLLKGSVAERWNQVDKVMTSQQNGRQLTDAGQEFTHHIGPRGGSSANKEELVQYVLKCAVSMGAVDKRIAVLLDEYVAWQKGLKAPTGGGSDDTLMTAHHAECDQVWCLLWAASTCWCEEEEWSCQLDRQLMKHHRGDTSSWGCLAASSPPPPTPASLS